MIEICPYSGDERQQETLVDLNANEPDLTAQELLNEDYHQLIGMDLKTVENPCGVDGSTDCPMDSIGETEVTALEDIGARQKLPPPGGLDKTDDHSVISVNGYDGMFVRWMENDESKRCLVCGKSFRWWRRRHVSDNE